MLIEVTTFDLNEHLMHQEAKIKSERSFAEIFLWKHTQEQHLFIKAT